MYPTTDVSQARAEDDRTRQILIVEDDKELAGLLSHWVTGVQTVDTSVSVATSLPEATERLGQLGHLDVVLLDRRLPEGMGDELLGTITAEFDPIVLMITGIQPEAGLIRLPVTDYLVKPIDEAVLVKRLSLLEKLTADDALEAYTDARKAALLEYHLDDPASSPMFRRFAARWEYDRLEVAIDDAGTYLYELYTGEEGENCSVSIIGELTQPARSLVETGHLTQVGEIVPSGDGHAWIDVEATDLSVPEDGMAVCSIDEDVVDSVTSMRSIADAGRIETILEGAY